MSDQDLFDLAAEHNRGDVALGMKPGQTRADIVNRSRLHGNIMPGELINRAKPTGNFQFTWCPINDGEIFADLKEEGYRVVTESEWATVRHEWQDAPEAVRRRWGTDRHLYWRDQFAMFRDEDLWKLQMANREEGRDRDFTAQKSYESAIEKAQSSGLAVEGTIAGQQFTVPAPKVRKSVNMGG